MGNRATVEMAKRHVSEGERRVRHQREIIADLKRDGHTRAAETAHDVLRTMEQSLGLARLHLTMELQAHGPRHWRPVTR